MWAPRSRPRPSRSRRSQSCSRSVGPRCSGRKLKVSAPSGLSARASRSEQRALAAAALALQDHHLPRADPQLRHQELEPGSGLPAGVSPVLGIGRLVARGPSGQRVQGDGGDRLALGVASAQIDPPVRVVMDAAVEADLLLDGISAPPAARRKSATAIVTR